MEQNDHYVDNDREDNLYIDNNEEDIGSNSDRTVYENQLADPEMEKLFLNEEPVRMDNLDTFIQLMVRGLGVDWQKLSPNIRSQLTTSIEPELFELMTIAGRRLMQLLKKEAHTMTQRYFDIKWDIFKLLSAHIDEELKSKKSSKEQIEQIKNRLLLLDRTNKKQEAKLITSSSSGLSTPRPHLDTANFNVDSLPSATGELKQSKRTAVDEGANSGQKKQKGMMVSKMVKGMKHEALQPGHLFLFLASSLFTCNSCHSESIQGDHIVILNCCRHHLCQHCLDYLALEQMTHPKRSCPFCHAFSPLALRIGFVLPDGNIDLSNARSFTYDVTKL